MSTTPDSTLANPDQRIADLERQLGEREAELAECKAERDEALQRETATAEVLGVINSSPGDLAPVFDAILEKAHALCAATHGVMIIREGEEFRPVAANGEPAFVDAFWHLGPVRPPEGSPPERLLRGERIVHVADFQAEDFLQNAPPQLRRATEIGGIRTMVAVPLRKDDAVIGIITAFRKEIRPFSDKQIALLENFAAQAVIAIENARLLSETREALEQQTATAEVLGVINSSPGDLAPVLDAMLERATALCGAAFGTLATYDGERFAPAAAYGVPTAFAAFRAERGAFAPPPGSSLERVAIGESLVHIADVMTDPGQAATPLVKLGGCRSLLCVALRKDGTLIGAITAYRQEVRPFSDKQIALLENFAAQAVIAMENARLINETRDALEQQTATAEVLQVINSSPGDLAPVFDAILEKAHNLCGVEYGALHLYDSEKFPAVATRGFPEKMDQLTRVGLPSTQPMFERLARGEVVQVPDLTPFAANNAIIRAAVEVTGTRTYLAVPLRQDRALLGYLSAHRHEVRPFSDKQIALLQNFGAQAVIAIENARLINETREALEQQTATAEVLGVINSSPGDLAPVFEAMLEKATTLCDAAFGIMLTWDGQCFHRVAFRGASAELIAALREPNRPVPGSMASQIVDGAGMICAADIRDEPAYRIPGAAVRSLVDIGGARSYVAVALRKDDALLGILSAYRQEVRPFSDKQIALLENFAAQAVIAMENARLLTETREALEQQTATAEVLQVINSSPGDLAPVFDAILQKALQLCDASFGNVVSYDGEAMTFVAEFGHREFGDWVRKNRSMQPGPTMARLVGGENVAHIEDLAATEDYRAGHALRRAHVDIGGFRRQLVVALRKDGVLLGAIAVFRQEVRSFSEKEIALLQNFAAQAVIAMENARLLDELRQRTDEVAELNRGLEARVAEQVEELGRVGRLKRFLAPQLAELIVSQGDEKILESHRREIVVVFCDLRGYTAFTETAEPEEVLDFLREYHGALGPLVSQYEGTLDQFSGDGIMVFFNDPVPCPDPAERAVKMAVAMREAAGKLIGARRRHGSELGFGAGIAQGYATLGQIGFSERSGYTAIGTVCNLAARLCAEAKDGQILISSHIAEAVEAVVRLENLGNLELKGLRRPVAAFNVAQSTSPADARPNLTVVAGGPEA